MSTSIKYRELRTIAADTTARNRDNSDVDAGYANYSLLQAIGNTIESCSTINEAETAMIASSLNRWATTRNDVNRRKIRPGDIVMADLGLNYSPELAYAHPAIVLEAFANMLMIVPTTSNPNDVVTAYHPDSNPSGRWYNRKVGTADGFAKDCAIVLNNLKIISKQSAYPLGRLTCSLRDEDGLFREIRRTILEKCFSKEYTIYKGVKLDKEAAEKKIEEKDEEIQLLNEEIKKLKEELEYLKNDSPAIKTEEIKKEEKIAE